MRKTSHHNFVSHRFPSVRPSYDEEKQKKNDITTTININRIYALAISMSIVFLVAGLTFVFYAGELSKEETIGYIQEATDQTKFAIEHEIDQEFQTLRTAFSVAEEKDLAIDRDSLSELHRALELRGDYELVGYADADGQAIFLDKEGREHHEDFSNEGYFIRALSGENAISRVRHDERSGKDIHYYAVPVYENGTDTIKGVLFTAISQDELRNVIDHSLYAGQGLAHIIDSNGEYILKSESPLVITDGNDIFSLTPPVDDVVKQEVLDDLAANRSGHFENAVYGENRLIAYTPLDINDWHVFYAVPEQAVSAGIRNVTLGSAIVVSVATGVFILLILLIRQVNNKSRKALETLAFVDPVTDQRNFQKFLIDAEGILKRANGEHYAVCYSDIKGFKYINDLFGRDVGDRLLRYWADIQKAIAQKGEISGRLSADTFVSICRYQNRQSIERRFDNIMKQLGVFPETSSHGYRVEVYTGVYVVDPDDGDLSLNDMLDRAIEAQKALKRKGGAKHLNFYSREMRERKLWETEVESKMDAALENNEFQVYLQPKIDIQHGDRIFGAEALVRWQSPEKGLIPPMQFIPLFERNGFILKLDKFVFETVCKYYQEFLSGSDRSQYILSVNVSRLALAQPEFLRSYRAIKEQYGVPDGVIELEFTESLAFENHELFKTTVRECKRGGFLCSMDDFGSGYSSLNVLKSIHVDILKLDRQFFEYGDEEKRGQELVRNIIAMAKDMGMKTIAEGIDDKDQVIQLRAMGCDAIQGYVFAKPMPMEDFKAFYESWQEN